MAGKLFLYILRKSQWIYVGAEFYDVFLVKMVDFTYFFNITSVKDHFGSWHMTFLVSVYDLVL